MGILESEKKFNIYNIIISIVILILIVSGIFLIKGLNGNNVESVKYSENGDVNYTVGLKENEYYSNSYLEKENQYISTLIDSVNANFKYNLNTKEDISCEYSYKIRADVNVIEDSTHKTIYNFSEDLLEQQSGKFSGDIDINKNVLIDYNKYNDLINEFVTTYNLENSTSTLTVGLYVNLDGKDKGSVISMDIPLTQNTLAFNVNKSLGNNVNNIGNVALNAKDTKANKIKLPIIFMIIDLIALAAIIIYLKVNETDEEKYDGQVRKILNNYGSFISKVEDELDMKDYQILKVGNFIDLLEIRDTMHLPIIMVENKENKSACFMITTNNNILYFYSLGVTQYALPKGNDTGKHFKDNTQEDIEDNSEADMREEYEKVLQSKE